jgi:hypothetical protein
LRDRRGLTAEEIDYAISQGWLCTWRRGEEVAASPKLAGIDPKGIRRTLLGTDGLGISALDASGNITGFQIASDNPGKGGKYIWASSASKGGNAPHLPSGELPIFVWRHPEATEVTETWLVEGGLKSLITALKLWFRHGRQDIQVIGAAGANFTGSLGAIAEALQGKIILCPDAGSLENSHILNNYRKIIEELTAKTYSCSVAWWEQFDKVDGDIDEIDNVLGFDLISPGEFFKLATDSSQDEQNDWAWRNWLKSRQFTPDIKVDMPKFRFPLDIPKENAGIGVKSELGTEKTMAMIENIRLSGNRAFMIGYRNNLLLQTGNRAGEVGLSIYHIREDDGKSLVADESTNLALCLDSIHHIDGYFKGVDIYLDETVSILIHACGGGTLKENQARALAILSKALKECNRVFALDGNLADLHCDFLAKVSGKPFTKILNEAKIPPHKFVFIQSVDAEGEIKKRDRSSVIKAMLGEGILPWVASDSKTFTDSLNEIFLQENKRGYVLNKDTSGEDWAKEFLLNPDKFIEGHKPEFNIISPTAESGVSVTIRNHFTDKFTFFSGVSGTNSQHQILFRLREDSVTHYVFCPDFSTVRDRTLPSSYSAKVFQQLANEKVLQSALLMADDNSSILEIVGKAISRSDDDWWQLSCQLGALDNFEMANLKKCLIHALREAGHEVTEEEWEADEGIKAREKGAKEAVRSRYALELFNAVAFASTEEASKASKSNPKKEVQRRIEKTWLLDKLPGIEDSELWGAELIDEYYLKDKEFISNLQRFYFLNNFEISKKRSEVNWYYSATNQHFFIGQNKADSHLKIWALQQLNILSFLEGEYHKNSPQLEAMVQMVRDRQDIQMALNTKPKPTTEGRKENIEFLRVLLASIGVKLGKAKQKLIDGVKTRIYAVDDKAMQQPIRITVLECIARKYDNYLQSESVAKVNWEEIPEIDMAMESEEQPAIIEDVPMSSIEMKAAAALEVAIASGTALRAIANGGALPIAPTPQESAAATMRTWRSWQDLNQETINLGWYCLTAEEQSQVNQLIATYPQQQPEEVVNPVGQACQVSHYGQWKPGIIRAWEELGKGIKAVIDIGGFEVWAWSREAVVVG